MPVQPTTWLDAFTANTDTAGTQNQTRVVQLSDGTFWVVWTDDNDTVAPAAGTDIVGQRYDALGNMIGGPVALNQWFVDAERSVSLAANPAGNGFLMVFVDDEAGDVQHIRLQVMSASGVQDTFISIADDPDAAGAVVYDHPQIAVASATNALIVFERVTAAGNVDIMGQYYNPTTNTLIGGLITIRDEADAITRPQVVALANGTYALTFMDEFAGTDDEVEGVVLDQAGAALGSYAAGTSLSEDNEASITALSGGNFVVTWTTDGDIFSRIYNNIGTAVTGTITVASGANIQNESNVVATTDGGFVVMWEDDSAGQTLAQAYDSAGLTIGSAFVFQNNVQDGGHNDHAAITLADGRIIYAGNLFGDATAEIIDPRAAPNTSAVYTPGDSVIGTVGDDNFMAAAGADATHGWDGNDTITDGDATEANLYGDDGNDTIIMRGISSLENADGGDGSDTLRFRADSSPSGNTTIDLAAGTATDSVDSMLATNFENADVSDHANNFSVIGTSGSNVIHTGSGNDTLSGNGGLDTLIGGAGLDQLDGGAGADSMAGGLGADTYQVDTAGDVVDETGGDGVDSVFSTVTFTLGAGVENLTLQAGAVNGFASNAAADANVITGNNATNILAGYAGNDTLIGNDGNDTLNGGDDLDVMEGGSGADQLNGGAGADTMRGGLASDTYIVDDAGDVVDETGGNGAADEVRSGITYTLGAAIENLTLTGLNATNGTGNASANIIIGNIAANNLNGGGGNDQLTGGEGDDTLIGSAGDDTMSGGIGNDLYFVESLGDSVSEAGGTGTADEVRSTLNFTLGAGLENLQLTGTATHGTGNGADNLLIGNAQNNVLTGGGGNDELRGADGNDQLSGGTGDDSMIGGAGNDRYFIDSLADVADESTGNGTADEARVSISGYTLALGVETLRLQGSAVLATGNSEANSIIGNAVGNDLRGQAGNDGLFGFGGNDTLRGGSGADSLFGGGGADVLQGGDDRDILRGDLGVDSFVWNDGEFAGLTAATADRVMDFTQGQDRLDLSLVDAVVGGGDSTFSFIGTSNFSGVGQLRYQYFAVPNVTLVEGDTNGDGNADFAIALVGNIALLATDFVL